LFGPAAQSLFEILKKFPELILGAKRLAVFPRGGGGRGRRSGLSLFAQDLGDDPADNGYDPDDHIHVDCS
jgi:hypothetical protein